MTYINLIDKLSTKDKEVLKAYIAKYGCPEKDFIGLNEWLEAWSHANQQLYHILGDSFIREFPYNYQKSRDDIKREIRDVLYGNPFKQQYHNFYWDYLKEQEWLNDNNIYFFNHLLDIENFVYERIDFNLKIKKPGAKKMLQIQAGTKPLKAIGRVIDYFKDDYDFNVEAFEEFKKKYAIIISEKLIKGRICLSIHPMDFITMSDNNSNWTSCMSWKQNGCYHVGTIEMMNSNNVVCAYLLNSSNDFIFDEEKIDSETGEIIGVWNNKRWRELLYITKDIIMGGKPYPYVSKEMTLAALDHLKELAKENKNWNYAFGPELYQDMVHIGEIWHMNYQRNWMHIEKKKSFKHNIIWDTKGMYNDMLNDHNTEYWCYRNKVNHTKIISVSGKAPCLCCGESIISRQYDIDDYNDRYENTGEAVCYNCINDKFKCSCCDDTYLRTPLYILKNGDKICKKCVTQIRICPCCGETFFASSKNEMNIYVYNNYLFDALKNGFKNDEKKSCYSFLYTYNDEDPELPEDLEKCLKKFLNYNKEEDVWMRKQVFELELFYICPQCYPKIRDDFKKNSLPIGFIRSWSSYKDTFYVVDPAVGEKYRCINLQKPELDTILASDTKLAT